MMEKQRFIGCGFPQLLFICFHVLKWSPSVVFANANASEVSTQNHATTSMESRHMELAAKRNELFDELIDVAVVQNTVIGTLEKEKISLEELQYTCASQMNSQEASLKKEIEQCERVVQALSAENQEEAIAQLERNMRQKTIEYDRCVEDYVEARKTLDTMQFWAPLSSVGVFLPKLTTMVGPEQYIDVSEVIYLGAFILLVLIMLSNYFGRCLFSTKRKKLSGGFLEKILVPMKILSKKQVCVLSNYSGSDLDLTKCSIGADDGDTRFEFTDGFLLASGCTVQIHAGPDAAQYQRPDVADHELFDSRTCPHLFWTTDEILEKRQTVTLENESGKKILSVISY